MKTFKPNPALRRVLACLSLVALLAVGVLRLAAHAQGEEDAPAPREASGGSSKAAVFIDKDRNSVVQVDGQSTSSDVSAGTVTAGSDLAAGLSAVNSTLEFNAESAAKMKGAKVSMFGQIDTSNSTVLASVLVPLQDELKKTMLTADVKVQQNDKNVHADIKVSGKAPKPAGEAAPFSKLTLDATNKTDYKTLNGSVSVGVTSPSMAQVPLKSLDITLADPDANTTTLDLTVVIDLANPMAASAKPQLEQLKANPQTFEAMLKSQLERFTKVDTLSLKADVTGNDGKVTLSIKTTGLRAKLNEMAQNGLSRAAGEGDPAAIKQAVDNLLAISITKLNLTAKVEKETLNATLTADVTNFDKFLAGYTTIMSRVQEMAEKQQEKSDDKAAEMAYKWWHAVQKKLNALSQTSAAEMAKASVSVTQALKVSVEVKDDIAFEGSFTQDAANFEKVSAALKSAGFPLMDGAGIIAHAKADGTTLNASLFASVKGNLPQAVKSIFVEPAQAEADLKQAADLLANLSWQDGRLQLTLTDNKLAYQAFAKTSDLTAITAAVQKLVMPSLTGTLNGVRIEVSEKDSKETSITRLAFGKFAEGKSADDVKTLVADVFSVSDVTVNDSADTKQVELAKLEQPKIEMPGDLASIKSEGEALVAAVPAPGEGGATTGGAGGMNKGVLIGVGVAILALLGIVMASGKKQG